jgi:hypothetical protein
MLQKVFRAEGYNKEEKMYTDVRCLKDAALSV